MKSNHFARMLQRQQDINMEFLIVRDHLLDTLGPLKFGFTEQEIVEISRMLGAVISPSAISTFPPSAIATPIVTRPPAFEAESIRVRSPKSDQEEPDSEEDSLSLPSLSLPPLENRGETDFNKNYKPDPTSAKIMSGWTRGAQGDCMFIFKSKQNGKRVLVKRVQSDGTLSQHQIYRRLIVWVNPFIILASRKFWITMSLGTLFLSFSSTSKVLWTWINLL